MDGFSQACKDGDISRVKSILETPEIEKEQDYDSGVSEGLFHTCFGKHLELFELLIDKSSNHAVTTVLVFACKKRKFDVAEFLLVHDKKQQIREIYLAECIKLSCDNETVVNLLIERLPTGDLLPERNVLTIFGNGLAYACETGNVVGAKLMIDKGAKNLGRCLVDACQRDSLEIIKLLVYAGAKKLNDALQHSSFNGKFQFVEFLLSKHIHSNQVLNTCLSYASKGNHLEIAKLLLLKGANNFEALSGKQIYELLQTGLPLQTFSGYVKYHLILNKVEEFQKNVREHAKDCLIPDLLMLVSGYCIW